MPGYKWNAFVAKVTNKFRYPDSKIKVDKVEKNTFRVNGECIFCVLSHSDDLIYEDDEISFFKDRKEDARFHMLGVSKAHIRDINALTPSHITMINRMNEIGRRILKDQFGDVDVILGFHHPPRNSIGHLHLHCIVKPLKHFKSKLSYSNYLWFITPEEVVKKIAAEYRIVL
jgi:sulfate adenylyltransferase (ADP) / adenylylsulfatase